MSKHLIELETQAQAEEMTRKMQAHAVHAQLLEATESAYTHLAIAWKFHEQMRTTADLRTLDQLEQAIRAAGGKVIGADGKEASSRSS